MSDFTPPPASIGIEEQIRHHRGQAYAMCYDDCKICDAIEKTLRRVPALERLHALCAVARRFDTGLQVDPKAFDEAMRELGD